MSASIGTDRVYRILSFDGGGVHAVSYLPLVDHLESYLGQQVAASGQFDMLVGTSTGAIVATAVKLGCRADTIIEFYRKGAEQIFTAHAGLVDQLFYKGQARFGTRSPPFSSSNDLRRK